MLNQIAEFPFLYVFGALFICLSALAMIVNPSVPGLRKISSSIICYTVALLLFDVDPSSNYFWERNIISNLALLLSGLFMLLGFSDLFEKPINRSLYIAHAFITILIYPLFIYLIDSYLIRVLLISSALTLYFCRALMVHLSSEEKWARPTRLIVVPTIGFLISIFLILMANALNVAQYLLSVFSIGLIWEHSILLVSLLTLTVFILANAYQMKQLNYAYTELENRMLFKQNLIRFLNHEFKTPLNAMSLKLEMLKCSVKDSSFTTDIEQLENINKSLTNVTDTFLNQNLLKNIEHSEHLSLRKIVDEVTSIPKLLAQKAKVPLSIYCGEIPNSAVLTDQNAIQIIFNNLVSNAIKFGGGGEITLEISTTEQHTQFSSLIIFKVVVTDVGIGMSRAELSNIYKPLWRSTKVSFIEGQGLGLPLVKNIIDSMNGTLFIDSRPNDGTKVTVILKMPILTPKP